MLVPFLIRWGCLECLAFPKGLTFWEPQHVRIKSAFNMPCSRILFLKSISENSLADPSGLETARTGQDTAHVLFLKAQRVAEWEHFAAMWSYVIPYRVLKATFSLKWSCSVLFSACSREQLPLINVFPGLKETEVIWGCFFRAEPHCDFKCSPSHFC